MRLINKSALIIIFSLLHTGCNKLGIPLNSNKDQQNTISTAIPCSPTGIDPTQAPERVGYTYVFKQIYEGLVKYDSNNQIQPSLATSWEKSKDGKEYTFFLRENVLFSNGEKFNAMSVKKNVERICNSRIASPSAPEFLGNIVGAKECIEGKRSDVNGIQVITNDIVKFRLTKPDYLFLHKQIYPVNLVVDTEAVGNSTIIQDHEKAIGTGPYVLKEFVSNSYFILKKNEQYWGEKAKIDEIKVSIIPDSLARLAKYQSGSLDFITFINSDISSIRRNSALNSHLLEAPEASVYYIFINPVKYPQFNNPNIRKAFFMAIDKQKLFKLVEHDLVLKAKGMIPYTFPGYNDNAYEPAFNPEQAKKILQDAGCYKKLPPIEVALYENPLLSKLAESIALQLNKHLGISVTVKKYNNQTLLKKVKDNELPFGLFGWGPGYLDPATFIHDTFYSKSPMNCYHYSNIYFDQASLKALDTWDYNDRMKAFQKAEDILLKSFVVYPMVYTKSAWLINPKLKGLKLGLMYVEPFNSLYLEKE